MLGHSVSHTHCPLLDSPLRSKAPTTCPPPALLLVLSWPHCYDQKPYQPALLQLSLGLSHGLTIEVEDEVDETSEEVIENVMLI